MNELTLIVIESEPRVDSRLIASQLGVEHKNTRALIEQYLAALENFGKVPFQTEASGKTSQQQKFYLLSENQAYLLLTMTRNTDQAVELKIRLVQAFAHARQAKPAELTREQILVMALESERERLRLAAELEAAQPMIQFHEEIAQGGGEFTIRETIKALFNRAISEQQLSAWMRQQGWLCQSSRDRRQSSCAATRCVRA